VENDTGEEEKEERFCEDCSGGCGDSLRHSCLDFFDESNKRCGKHITKRDGANFPTILPPHRTNIHAISPNVRKLGQIRRAKCN
jgi:hypothetical protein